MNKLKSSLLVLLLIGELMSSAILAQDPKKDGDEGGTKTYQTSNDKRRNEADL